MNVSDKLKGLRSLIDEALIPMIDNDYVLWGLPYYDNIGDVMIWEGTETFLRRVKHKCLGRANSADYYLPSLSEDVVILIQGGGYIGDTWRQAWKYVLEALPHYPKNKIVLLPNSVYYADDQLAKEDAEVLSKLKNLVICVRDEASYKRAKCVFLNEIKLVPDMAFYIDRQSLKRYTSQSLGHQKSLYLKRNDKEMVARSDKLLDAMVVRDWPTMDRFLIWPFIFKVLFGLYRKFLSKKPFSLLFRPIVNYVAYHFFRPYLLSVGVRFLSSYTEIVSTRLHPMVLAILLGKEVSFIDNSYGKIGALHATWLADLPIVHSLSR